MIRNIIFDWSGTLVDDLPAVLAATNFTLTQCGVSPLSLNEFRAEFCLPFTRFYDRFAPHVPLAQLEEWFHSHFRQVQDKVADLPYARDFLIFCQGQGVRMFVLSTMHPEYFKTHTATNQFDRFFEHPYLGILDKRQKIKELLTTHSLAPKETLFVGDMQHDIDTAKHGGVLSCAVLTGYNRLEQLRASEPDLIVEHLGELREILRQNRFELARRGDGLKSPSPAYPICTVGGLIFDPSGQALMIRTQKWSNLWGIPGGKIKFAESSVEALKREIKEETGLEVEAVEFVMAQDCIQSKEFYRDAHFVLLNYVCRSCGKDEVMLNSEAQEYRWVPLSQALAMELNKPTRILLEKVVRDGKVRRGEG